MRTATIASIIVLFFALCFANVGHTAEPSGKRYNVEEWREKVNQGFDGVGAVIMGLNNKVDRQQAQIEKQQKEINKLQKDLRKQIDNYNAHIRAYIGHLKDHPNLIEEWNRKQRKGD